MALANQSDYELFKKAERIYKAALAEVEPENLIKSNVSLRKEKLIVQDRSFDFRKFDNVYLAAIGKAAPFMTKSLLDALDDRIKEGIALCLEQDKMALRNVSCLPAPHPLPDENSITAAQNILRLAQKINERDLLLVLISGGGSAQICLPAQGVSLEEKRSITDSLLKKGASIGDLNIVRKHLSRIKGGRLAQAAFPGTVINLVISDVIHNDLESIASGPTYWDSSTYAEAFQVLRKYSLWDSVPDSIGKVIEDGIKGKIEETLKKESLVFKRVHNFVIGDNLRALQGAKEEAEKLGFSAFILTSSDYGEARDVAKIYTALLENIARMKKRPCRPLCLLAGGELTVTVKGKGKGGRNQEFALASFLSTEKTLKGISNWLILSMGSDGIDGSTGAAGAWISESTMQKVKERSLNPQKHLEDNDAYNFFKQVNGLVMTGRTHTNVMDLRMILIDR